MLTIIHLALRLTKTCFRESGWHVTLTRLLQSPQLVWSAGLPGDQSLYPPGWQREPRNSSRSRWQGGGFNTSLSHDFALTTAAMSCLSGQDKDFGQTSLSIMMPNLPVWVSLHSHTEIARLLGTVASPSNRRSTRVSGTGRLYLLRRERGKRVVPLHGGRNARITATTQ